MSLKFLSYKVLMIVIITLGVLYKRTTKISNFVINLLEALILNSG